MRVPLAVVVAPLANQEGKVSVRRSCVMPVTEARARCSRPNRRLGCDHWSRTTSPGVKMPLTPRLTADCR